MADLSITAANVVPQSGAKIEHVIAGETIAAGKVVSKATTGKYVLSDSDVSALKSPLGIAVNSASLNQPLAIMKSGDVVIGATLTAGVAYYLSNTPGGICPVADVGAGEDVVLIGLAKSTTILAVDIQIPGVTN